MKKELLEIHNLLNYKIYGEDISKESIEIAKKNNIVIITGERNTLKIYGGIEGELKILHGKDFTNIESENINKNFIKLLKEIELKAYWYGEINGEIILEDEIDIMWTFKIKKNIQHLTFDLKENDEINVKNLIIDIKHINLS